MKTNRTQLRVALLQAFPHAYYVDSLLLLNPPSLPVLAIAYVPVVDDSTEFDTSELTMQLSTDEDIFDLDNVDAEQFCNAFLCAMREFLHNALSTPDKRTTKAST